jgi:hypothetical protein
MPPRKGAFPRHLSKPHGAAIEEKRHAFFVAGRSLGDIGGDVLPIGPKQVCNLIEGTLAAANLWQSNSIKVG